MLGSDGLTMRSLEQVPDEIVRHILLFISPEDNLATVQRLSRRLNHLADEPILWKYYCRSSYRYWAAEHQFPQKLLARASEVEWKQLWAERKRADNHSARLLDDLLSTKVGRLQKLGQICQLEYDAKDFLLEQCRTSDSADDVLARRYYAHTALGSIHRGLAIQEWTKHQDGRVDFDGLDRALGAFDMFVLHQDEADMDEIERILDHFAADFRSQHRNIDDMSTRQKALALLHWVRAQNLTGMADPEVNYRNVRNCLIGQALCDPEHPSLPIISSAIYCCIAKRVGIQAAMFAFPIHVHTAVYPPLGQTLDGKPAATDDPENMLLDPYGSDDEVAIDELRSRLVEMGWNHGLESSYFLMPSSTLAIIQRTAQNLKASWARARELPDSLPEARELKKLRSGDPDLNLESVLYGAMWAGLIVTPTTIIHWDEILEGFLGRFVQNFSEDAWIVERYLMPLYDAFVLSHPRGAFRFGWQDARATLGMVHNLDARPPTANRRYTQDICRKVRYRIGQVFRHRRYGYIAIINGWAPDDTQGLPTPHNLSMDETAASGSDADTDASTITRHPRRQTFYTCLRAGVDRHVVSQDNVEIVTDPELIPETLFFLAGKFFKRFDKETCSFVSNIREFFPDD